MFIFSDKQVFVSATTSILVVIFFTKFSFLGLGLEKEVSLGILAAIGILVATMKYIYEKEKDRKNEIINLISFFREEVIKEHTKFGELVRVIFGKNIVFQRFRLDEVSLDWVKNNKSALADKQIDYVFYNHETRNQAVNTMNALEEFSAKIKILKAIDSPELEILYSTFVMIFEDLAILVLDERELGPGETIFRNSVKVYELWSKRIDRKNYDERRKNLYKGLGIKK